MLATFAVASTLSLIVLAEVVLSSGSMPHERWVRAVALQAIAPALAFAWLPLYWRRWQLGPTAVGWLRTCLAAAFAACVYARALEGKDDVAYVFAMASWGITLDVGFVLTSSSFHHIATLNTVVLACAATAWVVRPAPIGVVPRWDVMVWAWFTLYAYASDRASRQAFVRACQLAAARRDAEEVALTQRFLLHSVRDMIAVHAAGGSSGSASGGSGELRYVSRACVRVLGVQPSQLVGTRLVDLVHPDDAAAVRALLSVPGAAPAKRPRGAALARSPACSGEGDWVMPSWRHVLSRLWARGGGRIQPAEPAGVSPPQVRPNTPASDSG
jgi:PAS domain-containing protein